MAKAFGAATDALADGDLERAAALLEWAKGVAPRSAAVREALGIVHYQAGDYAAASSELLTYRRLSARQDQNHLLADTARAAGRAEKADEYVEAMVAARVEPERIAEGLLVLAGARADRGDVDGALRALQRADLDPVQVQPWHPRLWWFAAELNERRGDFDAARDYLEAILAIADDEEVERRLRSLEGR